MSKLHPELETLLETVVEAFDSAGVVYAIGGAVAMAAHGYRRYTEDVDTFIRYEDLNLALRKMRQVGLDVYPIAEPFHYKAGDLDGFHVDLLFPLDEPDVSAIKTAEVIEIAGVAARVFRLEWLVASKFQADDDDHDRDISKLYRLGLFEPATVAFLIADFDKELAEQFQEFVEGLRQPRRRRR